MVLFGKFIWAFPKNNGILQIIHFHRGFHYFNHPFWGTLIFGNTHIKLACGLKDSFNFHPENWGRFPF